MGRWNESIADFYEVLKLDPSNLAAQAELQRAQSSQKLHSSVVAKPPRRRRVPITIMENDHKSSSQNPQAANLQRRVPITIIDDASSHQDVPDNTISDKPSDVSLLVAPQQSQVTSVRKDTSSILQQVRKVSGGVFREDGTSHIISPPLRKQGAGKTDSNKGGFSRSSVPPHNWNLAALARYFSVEKDPQMRWLVIQYTHPDDLRSFISHSLSSEILVQYIETFEFLLNGPFSDALKGHLLSYMKSFPSIERFQTIILFLGKEDRSKIKNVFERLGSDRNLDSLQATWGI